MNRPHTLVVGGTRGIGRAVARRFAQLGHAVSVLARRLPRAAETGEVAHCPVDLSNRRALQQSLRALARERGAFCNAVFVQRYRGEGDTWEGELDVSLGATRAAMETLRDGLFAPAGASVVFVSSNLSRLVADEQSAGYHVAKAGLRQLARYYAVALGAAAVRVNCVTPGTVLKEESRDFYLAQARLRALYRRITPLGRMGSPEDIADAVAFLCSPQAAFVTGHDLVVDGGLSLHWQESLARAAAGLGDLRSTPRTPKSRRNRKRHS